MNFRAVLFDLDGTLLDTIEDLTHSMNKVLDRFGFPGHDLEAYKYFVGEGVEVMVCRALPRDHRDPATKTKCIEAMREEYGRRWAERTRPYEGIPELLDDLTARKIKMAILSNKPDNFTQIMVAKLLSPWHFDAVAGARPSVPKKPDPRGALEIAEQLGIPAREFVYLGDTHIDVKTACAAGMFPVGVLWGFRQAEELKSAGARLLIKAPDELLKLLDRGLT